jgi:hypothetical protein
MWIRTRFNTIVTQSVREDQARCFDGQDITTGDTSPQRHNWLSVV